MQETPSWLTSPIGTASFEGGKSYSSLYPRFKKNPTSVLLRLEVLHGNHLKILLECRFTFRRTGVGSKILLL